MISRIEILADSANYSEKSILLFKFAALFHDFGHSGNSYRQKNNSVERNEISNEEYSALKADEYLHTYST